jgi:hypothetical protein
MSFAAPLRACALLALVVLASSAAPRPSRASPRAVPIAPRANARALAAAHTATTAVALITFDEQGALELKLRHDALAFALDEVPRRIADEPMLELLAQEDAELEHALHEAGERFASLCELWLDGQRVRWSAVRAPSSAEVRAWQAEFEERVLPVRLDLRAQAQLGAAHGLLELRFPEVLGDVIATLDRHGLPPVALPLRAGERSRAWPISARVETSGAAIEDSGAATQAAAPGRASIARAYLELGLLHILPRGLDHVLFVLALFFLGGSRRALLVQVSAFTLAHSLTLALAVLGFVRAPAQLVEVAIAASIALIALENFAGDRAARWRAPLVFAFGLLHGLGFAGVLAELGLPRGELVLALLCFNAGVELGQLAVLAAAFLALGWWRGAPWYRRAIAWPASAGIALVGLWWTVERL